MRILPADSTDDLILGVVREWVAMLSSGDYVGAYQMMGHEDRYGWSPDLIRKVIEGYGSPKPHRSGHKFRVSTVDHASGKPAYRKVERFSEPIDLGDDVIAIADVLHDLPLDGMWSDLTARFQVQTCGNDMILVLEEIHVF